MTMKLNINKILNLFIIKNLYINRIIDTIYIVAYKNLFDSNNRFIESYKTKRSSTI